MLCYTMQEGVRLLCGLDGAGAGGVGLVLEVVADYLGELFGECALLAGGVV